MGFANAHARGGRQHHESLGKADLKVRLYKVRLYGGVRPSVNSM